MKIMAPKLDGVTLLIRNLPSLMPNMTCDIYRAVTVSPLPPLTEGPSVCCWWPLLMVCGGREPLLAAPCELLLAALL